MKFLKAALMGGCVALAGCAGPIVLNYAPSSTMAVKGTEKVGTFDYAPAKSGRVKANQIRNTAIGNIFVEKPIPDYFERAVFTESRFVGIDTAGSHPVVHGTIDEFLIDDLGYSVDWTLNVTYVVDAADGSTCFKEQKKLAKHTAKFANVFGTLNEVVKDNIELLFKDPAFVSCINGANVAQAGAPHAAAPVVSSGTIVSPQVDAAPVAAPPAVSVASAAPVAPVATATPVTEPVASQQATPETSPAQDDSKRLGRPLSYIHPN